MILGNIAMSLFILLTMAIVMTKLLELCISWLHYNNKNLTSFDYWLFFFLILKTMSLDYINVVMLLVYFLTFWIIFLVSNRVAELEVKYLTFPKFLTLNF